MTLTCLLWLLLVPSLAEPTPDEVRQATNEVYEADAYQRDLPGIRDVPVTGSLPEPQPEARRDERDFSSGVTGFGAIARALMWIVVAAVAVFAIVWIVRELPQRGWRTKEKAAPVAVVAPAAAPIPAPQALAAEGRYGEAIHVLLLELIAQLGERVAPAWTSREVLRRLRWPDDAKKPVRNLVGRVEQIMFGGKTAGPADFDAATADATLARDALAKKKAAL